MERTDKELIQRFLESNPQLRRLYAEHETLETRLNKLGRKAFLTPDEQLEARRLKKRKLFGVDRMMEIIAPHRMTA